MRFRLSFLGILFVINAIGQNNPIGITYHNVTARFNGYFIAKERILEIEQSIKDQHKWDYNEILPIFPQYDTTTSKSLETPITDCIEKASIAIQRHPESRWEDDAYILVGKARLYGSEFPEAIETFKWVNTNGDDKNDQHKALIFLLRTFVEAKEYKNALAVFEYLSKQEINEENKNELALNLAYYYQKKDDLPNLVENLTFAEKAMPRGNERSRIDFIIGQVYQELEMDSEAYSYYRKGLKSSSDYELSFFTKLNMALVSQLGKENDQRKVQKYFKKLLKDPKNEIYKDRIYYQMGQFSFKKGMLSEAIKNYKLSISNGKDNRQKSYAFLKLATIYYDSLRDYELAKVYYDSTLQILPEDTEGYEILKVRQEVLGEFVKYFNILNANDSLINLSRLPLDELEDFLENQLDSLEVAFLNQKEKKKKEERRERISNQNEFYNQSNQVSISSDLSGTWYFYNTSEVSRGRSQFLNTWGEIKLEENWRRSQKSQISDNTEETEEVAQAQTETKEKKATDEPVFDREGEREKLLATIPSTQEEKNKLLQEIEEAYYQLGNIYNFKLQEKDNAVLNFVSLLDRFPESAYRPEVLYQLFLLFKPLDSMKSSLYANQLTDEFPESDYAKLVFNPNYVEESKALLEAYKKAYKTAYNLYENAEHKKSIALIDSVLAGNERNEFTDNLALLKAMNYGETDGVYKYQFELNNFIKQYPDSDLLDYANVLVKASEDFQINLYSSSRGKYIRNFDDIHYFLFIYELSNKSIRDTIPDLIELFIKENDLDYSSGNLVLDKVNALVLVNQFKSKQEAEVFIASFNDDFDPGDEIKLEGTYPLIITKDNFDILYETKDLENYLSFYKKYYSSE